jgi:phospholipid/cholesterol/gamma-HCH transport system permease protein
MMQKTEGMAGDIRRERDVLRLLGDWTLPHYRLLERKLEKIPANFTRIDFSGLGALDTAGASLLAWRLGEERLKTLIAAAPELSSERRALLLAVGAAAGRPREVVLAPSRTLASLLADIGKCVVDGVKGLGALLNFAGLTLVSLIHVLPHPKRWRLVSLVSHIQQTGLNAVPIVALLTFLVGAVVAFLGATVLNIFGATIYTVDLVAYAFEREFGVLLAAILLAGRTASSFTAQVGSMKVNEEIDALQAQGLDPMEMLVLPRVLALLISLPLLTFVAVASGMVGGAVVAVFSLDISISRYLDIIQTVSIQHFLTGIAKAPVFAFVIAIIGCLEGFKVEGSARSVGAHTTSSVVQSIFMVILLDAIAAMFFMEMKW